MEKVYGTHPKKKFSVKLKALEVRQCQKNISDSQIQHIAMAANRVRKYKNMWTRKLQDLLLSVEIFLSNLGIT